MCVMLKFVCFCIYIQTLNTSVPSSLLPFCSKEPYSLIQIIVLASKLLCFPQLCYPKVYSHQLLWSFQNANQIASLFCSESSTGTPFYSQYKPSNHPYFSALLSYYFLFFNSFCSRHTGFCFCFKMPDMFCLRIFSPVSLSSQISSLIPTWLLLKPHLSLLKSHFFRDASPTSSSKMPDHHSVNITLYLLYPFIFSSI